MNLTDPDFIRRLETLALLTRRVLGGRLQADRRTHRKGAGVSFADYSEYKLGDDHRAIDWRVLGRLEQLVIKMFEVEEDMSLVLLLDTSRSMTRKFEYATKLTAALGFIALSSLDEVRVHTIGSKLDTVFEPTRGRGRAMRMLRSLERAECDSTQSDFDACCRTLAARLRRRAMIVPVSDFLFPGGFDRGLRLLRHHHHDIFCIQVQDDMDRACDLRGDVELECVETGQRRRVTVTPAQATAYERAVSAWNESLKSLCSRQAIGLASTVTDIPFDDVIQRILRRGGLVS